MRNMTKEQRMEAVLVDAFGGLHHVDPIKKHKTGPVCWQVNILAASTWDFNVLTLLVLAAHRYAVRVDLGRERFGLKLTLHPREGRRGSSFQRHPTIEEAIAAYKPSGEYFNVEHAPAS